ncbi:TPA: phage tail protein [Escherichia coli]|uniref:phage tail-collar fiber domain-containing protein n=1 Tax=Enterobacteriaceae TaxID=543 RepID=UPI0018E1C45D|nr:MULTISPECIES: phage tail protein [Enterobacteriaceae]EKZ9998305.1 phage tail protein [Klebsiella pneumoniae]ELA2980422.1 phage tail protein [Klebsiella pneumoniae]ELK1286111.1 phage tail protein [Escherichia coli]MBI0772835.1 phage tail protein [Escherichia coli]MBV0179931.1 phage tail protein [Klebsiella pneumoniae]
MSTKFYTLLTDIGAAKLASAAALGVPLKITHMAVGDGGGTLPTPDAKQTALVNEKRRAALNMLYIDPQNSSQIIAEQVIPENEGGWWIREVGLFDESGALIAVGNCPESYKPQLAEGSGRTQTVRMVLITSSTDNITLKIDPAVVLATRKYVDDKISEHEQSRRHPDASLTAKGFTQLSSATNSESEILAATPKAVKAAYDLAAGKASASHTHPWNQITDVPAASLTVKGTVQLSSATNSTSETQAATPKAVKAAYDLAAGKAPVSHTHPWSQITDVPAASLTVKGTVQLSSATNSTSETQAATPKAVKAVYDLANGKQPADATLTALAGLATAADKLPYFTGNDTASLTTLTNVGRDILAKTSKQEVIHYLGLGATNGYVGRLVNTRVFTSSGTYTPTPGTKRIRVTITGGGGGGGGCKAISNNETFFGAGGGAGGTIISIMTPTQNSYPVTIGAGGAGGVSATYGINGGNSLFASLIAPGGAGGGKSGVTNTNGGNGGVPSTGDINIIGGCGGDGQSGNIGVSGEGGTSYWGGGGRAGAGGGVSGKAYGSGGGGAYDAGYSGTSMTGGKGAAGICIIEEFA